MSEIQDCSKSGMISRGYSIEAGNITFSSQGRLE